MYVRPQALSYSGQPGYDCKHLQNVKFADLFTDELPLSENKFEEVKGLNWISERRRKECVDFKEEAAESSASFIDCLPAGESYSGRYIHFSVFSDKTEYWCLLGRVRATYNKTEGTRYCACSQNNNKRSCVYKYISKWYLHEHAPEILKVSDQHLLKNKDEDLPDGKSDADAKESFLSSFPDERLAKRLEYIKENK